MIVGQVAKATIANWVNTPMTRLVCAEAFNTVSGAKNHLGCMSLNFGTTSTNMSNINLDVPLMNLPSGTYRLVYTYQDAGGFWHQMTNSSDQLVTTTVTR